MPPSTTMLAVPNTNGILCHIEDRIGHVSSSFSSNLPGRPQIDINFVPSSHNVVQRVAWLVTSGLSAQSMLAPELLPYPDRIELCLNVPLDWSPIAEGSEEPHSRWPVQMLGHIARRLHRTQAWVGPSHTIDLGELIDQECPMSGACLLMLPRHMPEEAKYYTVGGHSGMLLEVFPIHHRELLYADGSRALDLLDLLENRGLAGSPLDFGRLPIV